MDEKFRCVLDECPEGMSVCGTLGLNGEPIYFYMPEGVDDDVVRDEAFRLRNGRVMTAYERLVLEEAAHAFG